jgi:clan AA aspartic protease
MGEVYTRLTLKNAVDEENVWQGLVEEGEVRQTTVEALVDTGAWTLVLTEETARKLGLRTLGPDSVTVAGGTEAACLKAGPVRVYWEDRSTVCEPIVLPGQDENLLGAIPMEGMDVVVSPKLRQVVGRHGGKAKFKLPSVHQ